MVISNRMSSRIVWLAAGTERRARTRGRRRESGSKSEGCEECALDRQGWPSNEIVTVGEGAGHSVSVGATWSDAAPLSRLERRPPVLEASCILRWTMAECTLVGCPTPHFATGQWKESRYVPREAAVTAQ